MTPFIPPFGTPPTNTSILSKKLYDAVVDVAGNGDFTDIEAAIDAGAKSIFVLDGTYTLSEAIDVDVAGIEITGETKTGTIIDGNTGSHDMFIVTATNFVIRNLTIDKAGEDFAGIATNATNITMDIDRIVFNNCDIAVIVLNDSVTTTMSNCTIAGTGITTTGTPKIGLVGGSSCISRITNCDVTTAQSSNDTGVKIGTGGGADGGEIFITNCLFTVTLGIGIDSNISARPSQIVGSRFDVAGNNIGIDFSARGRVLQCYFNQTGNDASSDAAIKVREDDCEIIGNTIEDGFWHGIFIAAPHCRIIGNRIEGCADDGINFSSDSSGADGNVIMGNIAQLNTGFGVNVTVNTQQGNIIIGNVFTDNTAGAINDSGTGTEISNNVTS